MKVCFQPYTPIERCEFRNTCSALISSFWPLEKLTPRSLLTEVLGPRLGRFSRSLHRQHSRAGGLRAMTRLVGDDCWSDVIWSVKSQVFPGKGCSIKVHHVTKDDSGYWRWSSYYLLILTYLISYYSVNSDSIIPSCSLKLEQSGTILTKKKPIDILGNVC